MNTNGAFSGVACDAFSPINHGYSAKPMEGSLQASRPVIVCALEFERRALLRHGLGSAAEIQCCGPGSAGVRDWARSIQQGNRLVILCGVAGGLDPKMAAGEARLISEVIDAQSGERWKCALTESTADRATFPTAKMASCLRPLGLPREKADLFRRTGAQLVDTESSEFSREATANGWRWMIVRGVSDSAGESLPREATNWVDANGRTRHLALIATVLRRPSLVPVTVRLGRNSGKAMASVSEFVRKIVDSETHERACANS